MKKAIDTIQIGAKYTHKLEKDYHIMVTSIEEQICTVKRLHLPDAPLVEGLHEDLIKEYYYEQEKANEPIK